MGSVILFLVVLSVLVLVHEAGHFFTALWIGAKVEEFGVGFPPRALSKIKNGIRYSINWIPLGGFVKIKGESGADRTDPDSFGSKPAWKRFIVLIAGVAMNVILAAVLFSIGYGIGMPQVIDDLAPSAHVRDEMIYVVNVAEASPAGEAGIAAGDILQSIDSNTFASADEAQAYIQSHTDAAMTLVVKRDADFFTYTATPRELPEAEGRKVLGVGLVTTGVVSYPLYLAPVKGVEATIFFTKEILIAFYDLIKNLIIHQEVAVDLSGPVGIAVMTGEVAKLGFVYLLQFGALLSINLAVINVLPFPALDGGRILFLVIEKVIGRPVPSRVEGIVHSVGFMLLMALVVLVTYKDLVKFL
ncbi:MAG: RIP metalloprotease RseP [Patescibacteria group bacterium]